MTDFLYQDLGNSFQWNPIKTTFYSVWHVFRMTVNFESRDISNQSISISKDTRINRSIVLFNVPDSNLSEYTK